MRFKVQLFLLQHTASFCFDFMRVLVKHKKSSFYFAPLGSGLNLLFCEANSGLSTHSQTHIHIIEDITVDFFSKLNKCYGAQCFINETSATEVAQMRCQQNCSGLFQLWLNKMLYVTGILIQPQCAQGIFCLSIHNVIQPFIPIQCSHTNPLLHEHSFYLCTDTHTWCCVAGWAQVLLVVLVNHCCLSPPLSHYIHILQHSAIFSQQVATRWGGCILCPNKLLKTIFHLHFERVGVQLVVVWRTVLWVNVTESLLFHIWLSEQKKKILRHIQHFVCSDNRKREQ